MILASHVSDERPENDGSISVSPVISDRALLLAILLLIRAKMDEQQRSRPFPRAEGRKQEDVLG
jgi:hypothetical protein